MSKSLIDYIGWGLIVLCLGMAAAMIVAIPVQMKRSDIADAMAAESGCVNLGHPRDMNTVYFFDCDGQIILKRVR